MQNKRRHRRYRLDSMEINGMMNLVDKVEILDISLGGASLKTDKKLEIGKEYQIKLGDGEKTIDVQGVIVRSEFCGNEERPNGEKVPLYAAGMKFDGSQMNTLAMFLYTIDQKKKKMKTPAIDAERRLSIRFQIATPGENALNYPTQFKVKTISMSGMLIQTDHSLEIGRCFPMGLSLQGNNSVAISGRIVMCQMKNEGGRIHYDIGVEFRDVSDKDKTALKAFTDNLAAMEAGAQAKIL